MRALLLGLMVVMSLGGALEARGDVGVRARPHEAMARARTALSRHQSQVAIETLASHLARPGALADASAPGLLMLLGEAAERHVKQVNDRYWRRSRLNPRAPSWLSYVRQQQRWAERRHAGFSYYDPRGRYRYDGQAYRILVERHPRHPLAEEAEWRLIHYEDDGEHRADVNPALLDAKRHERFLKRYPKSRHRLAARLAIGWDYLYASGFTWGSPDRARFTKGQRILEAIVRGAPGSPEARKAAAMLQRAREPFGAAGLPPRGRP